MGRYHISKVNESSWAYIVAGAACLAAVIVCNHIFGFINVACYYIMIIFCMRLLFAGVAESIMHVTKTALQHS